MFFLKKIKVNITPYADIFAWCLMPNHFHLMVLVNEVELPVSDSIHRMTGSHPVNNKKRTLNDFIAIMLRSYTRAINKQENRSGSIFRESTKADCLNCFKGITPSFITKDGITKININNPEKKYPQICFNYIHDNPVKAGLVVKPEDWEFSSARDYPGLRNCKLINKEIEKQYIVTRGNVTQSRVPTTT
ncbi:MAG: hypothetical protein K8R53_05975 [Bacteroidales bacterium]|nr:hypothetical protein [Bacteroidales bacterium]